MPDEYIFSGGTVLSREDLVKGILLQEDYTMPRTLDIKGYPLHFEWGRPKKKEMVFWAW